jgi:hypothetical protein
MSNKSNKSTVFYGSERIELNPNSDLVELNRQLAALKNPHMHDDLLGIPEVERQVALADVLEQIEEILAAEQTPWQTALEEAVCKVDDGIISHAAY